MDKTTVLIVEDEVIVAADLAGKLKQLGYDVVGMVDTGEKAVDLACGLKPQVVLMDIRLKGEMDGIEAAEAINRRHCAPVIYLTAHSDSATLERAKLSGPFGYILKPFEERELSTTIEMALFKHQSDMALRRSHDELEQRVEERTRELKAAHESAKAERQRLFDVLETLPAMICLLTPDYHVAFANKSFRDRFGESHGRRCFDYCFGKTEPCDFCESYEVLKTGESHHWEVNGEDGSVISAYDFPFTDVDGSPLILEMDLDITEQRQAEEAVRKANAYNRSLLEASVDPLVTIGHDGRIMDVNTATEKATGLSRADLIGTDFCNYFSEPEIARAGYEQVFAKGTVRDYPLELLHRDGGITSVLYNASVYHDEKGEVLGVFAAARDITELKRAEKALMELNATLEERVIERTAQLNSANETLRASRMAALNLMEDAVISRKKAEEVSEELRLEIVEREQVEAELLRSNKRMDLLAMTAGRLLASDSPQHVVNELCMKVMEFLDCHAFFNFLVNEETGCLRLNTCAGIPEEEAKRIEWLDYGSAVCGCAARDACRIVAEDIPNTPDPRTDLVKSFGIQAYACHPLMAQGRVLGTLSFGTRSRPCFSDDDLSLMKAVVDQVAIAMERKRVEEELRLAKEAAETASRAKSQFLANMSHELRTPMTGVLGMLEIARGGTLDDKQREALDIAYASGQSLISIINDILDLTKVESGKLVIEEKPFDLADCVACAVDILIPEARRKGLDLVRSVANDLPRTVNGDRVRLQQILTNLAGNAVKFTESGKIEVNVTSGKNLSEGKKEIIFTVTDTGIGVPDDMKELIFGSFNQADVSHTRRFGGTGLGLSISKELVEKMGGTLSFESTEGKGSSFTFSIPLCEVESEIETEVDSFMAAPVENIVTLSDERKARILIAEDDEITRKILGYMLQQFKYDLDFATDGLKAVEMWENGNYDLIIMDGQMPLMDGFSATSAIRERERKRGGRIPIVAMTAHALREDKERCIAIGMDAYVSKPIDFKHCIEVIQRLLGMDRGE